MCLVVEEDSLEWVYRISEDIKLYERYLQGCRFIDLNALGSIELCWQAALGTREPPLAGTWLQGTSSGARTGAHQVLTPPLNPGRIRQFPE